MLAIMLRYRFQLVTALGCPLLVVSAIVLSFFGMLIHVETIAWLGVLLFATAIMFMPLVGLFSAAWSWRMARAHSSEVGDVSDVLEFLLGAGGLAQVILGGFLWPTAVWMLLSCFSKAV